MTDAAIVASSLVLAGVVGFAAHRASICTVKAVEEIFATRRALMFASFAKTVLWIIAAALVMQILVPESRIETIGWAISLPAILGGLIFSVGAVVNGGCAFSTLTRLGAGQVGMVVTLIGFALGVALTLRFPVGPQTLHRARHFCCGTVGGPSRSPLQLASGRSGRRREYGGVERQVRPGASASPPIATGCPRRPP